MKKMNRFKLAAFFVALSCLVIGCNTTTADKTETSADSAVTATTMEDKPDMGKLKGDIQALETSWAAADNARDTNAVAAFYADDAVSFANNKPMLVGKDAIHKDIAATMAKRAKGATVAYDVMDVYGDEDHVTETGKITVKDASGKVTYTGKYMAVWELRNGKYVCIRDMSNDDVIAK